MLGSTLYNLILFWAYNVYVYFIFSILIGLVMAFIAFKFFESILIWGTALFGAYILVRGISMFAGHYPNEVEIIKQLSHGIKPDLDAYFYIYLAGIIVAFILGVVVQKKFQEPKKIEDHYQRI